MITKFFFLNKSLKKYKNNYDIFRDLLSLHIHYNDIHFHASETLFETIFFYEW